MEKKERKPKAKEDGSFHSLNFKLYSKALIIKTIWYWNKDKLSGQLNSWESKARASVYNQLIFNKGQKKKE